MSGGFLSPDWFALVGPTVIQSVSEMFVDKIFVGVSVVMCYEAITCPDCSSLNIVENGKTAQRKQRYCAGTAVRALIVPLTMNGSGVRDISRVLLVSLNTLLKTLR